MTFQQGCEGVRVSWLSWEGILGRQNSKNKVPKAGAGFGI